MVSEERYDEMKQENEGPLNNAPGNKIREWAPEYVAYPGITLDQYDIHDLNKAASHGIIFEVGYEENPPDDPERLIFKEIGPKLGSIEIKYRRNGVNMNYVEWPEENWD